MLIHSLLLLLLGQPVIKCCSVFVNHIYQETFLWISVCLSFMTASLTQYLTTWKWVWSTFLYTVMPQYFACTYFIFADSSSGNRTTGSWSNSLVGQLTLQNHARADSDCSHQQASFVQNPFVLRWLVYGPFIDACFTWWLHSSLIAWAYWASNTEHSTPQSLLPRWISEKLLYRWVSKKKQSQQWSPNLRRPFLRASEFSIYFAIISLPVV